MKRRHVLKVLAALPAAFSVLPAESHITEVQRADEVIQGELAKGFQALAYYDGTYYALDANGDLWKVGV